MKRFSIIVQKLKKNVANKAVFKIIRKMAFKKVIDYSSSISFH